jgi:hypothetical protein
VSLILEALKKLDREKQAPERGVLVVGPAAWPSVREGPFALRGAPVVLAAMALGGTAGAIWLLRSPRPSAVPAAPGVAASPAMASAPVVAPSDVRPGLVRPAPAGGPRPAVQPAPGTAARPPARPAPAAEEPEAALDGASSSAGEETEAAPLPAPTTEAPARPTRPSGAADFQLQAISAQDGRPVAVLNDRLVREGDTFDGVRVLRIGADEVEIEVAGGRRIVKF